MANKGAPHKPLDECLSSGSSNKKPKPSDSNKASWSSNSVVATGYDFTYEREVASSVKKFLELGFLNGVVVICLPHRSDVARSDGKSGIIIGKEIHCLCEICEFEKHKMFATNFESHGGSRKKNPADSFYLDDRLTTLKEIMNMCKVTPKTIWGSTIKKIIAGINGQRMFDVCKRCKDHHESKSGLRLPTECETSQGSAQPREEFLFNILRNGSAPNCFGDYKNIGSNMTDDEVLGLCFKDKDFCEYFSS